MRKNLVSELISTYPVSRGRRARGAARIAKAVASESAISVAEANAVQAHAEPQTAHIAVRRSISAPLRVAWAASAAFAFACSAIALTAHMGGNGASGGNQTALKPWSELGPVVRAKYRPHGDPARFVPQGTPADFAPFTRDEAVAVVRRWMSVSQVVVRPVMNAPSTDYSAWKARANAFIASLADRGETQAAALCATWIATYEAHEAWKDAGGPEPPQPSRIPGSLKLAAGGDPPGAFRGVQCTYTVTLPGVVAKAIFADHPVDPDYPYLINPTGVANKGLVVAARPDADAIFQAAGIDGDARTVFKAVSKQEGGFEAVNTYDTGYVSVGFIQFAAMQGGNGSLAAVLERMRLANPVEFKHYFHDLGVDVDDAHELVAIDPNTGRVLRGADAVLDIRDDKRLTAVFFHAGKTSQAFQAAQVAQARDGYYAPGRSFSIPVAKVTDYTNPYQPVSTYYYGDAEIAKARQAAAAGNALPWSPPRTQRIPHAPPIPTGALVVSPLSPGGTYHPPANSDAPDYDDADSTPPPSTVKNVGPLDNAPISSPPTESAPLVSGFGGAKPSDNNDTAETDDPTAPIPQLGNREDAATPPAAAAPKPLPDLPSVDGAPTKQQVKHALKLGVRPIVTKRRRVVIPMYHGPHYVFEQLDPLMGSYGDVFRSEAGRTAITDRCIQHGFDDGEGLLGKFTDAIASVCESPNYATHEMSVDDLASLERDLIPLVQNRIMLLADSSLGQPGGSTVHFASVPRRRHRAG